MAREDVIEGWRCVQGMERHWPHLLCRLRNGGALSQAILARLSDEPWPVTALVPSAAEDASVETPAYALGTSIQPTSPDRALASYWSARFTSGVVVAFEELLARFDEMPEEIRPLWNRVGNQPLRIATALDWEQLSSEWRRAHNPWSFTVALIVAEAEDTAQWLQEVELAPSVITEMALRVVSFAVGAYDMDGYLVSTR